MSKNRLKSDEVKIEQAEESAENTAPVQHANLSDRAEKIRVCREFWASEFDKIKVRYVASEEGFVIHTDDHPRAMKHMKYIQPARSAETAALFFVYDSNVK